MVGLNGKENGVQEPKFLREIKDHLKTTLKKWTMKKNFLLTQMMEYSLYHTKTL
jgi:hypothetical protein